MKKLMAMAALAAGLLVGTASAEVLAIKVTAVDPANKTISGANPTMASDVRTFKYRDMTAGVKMADSRSATWSRSTIRPAARATG